MAAVDASSDCQLRAFTPEGGYDLSIVGLLREFEPEPGVDVVFSPTLADGVAYSGTSESEGAIVVAVTGDR